MNIIDANGYINHLVTSLATIASSSITYLHIGGKLQGDFHAGRVLPGFPPDLKLSLVQRLDMDYTCVFLVSGTDIEKQRIRGDYQINYFDETLRSIKELRENGVRIDYVIMTEFNNGLNSIYHDLQRELRLVDIELLKFERFDSRSSSLGIGDSPLVIVISPGSGSGKVEFCMSQLVYLAGYSNQLSYLLLDIFPIYELNTTDPINLAYFAAVADKYNIPDDLLNNNNWNSFPKTKKIIDLMKRAIASIPDGTSVYTNITEPSWLSIFPFIDDLNEARKCAIDEIYHRKARYEKEVKLGLESQQTLNSVNRLIEFIK